MYESTDSSPPNQTSPEINTLELPLGYFDAQVRFAQKWSQITGDNFVDVLRNKTALYRRLAENQSENDITPEQWSALLTDVDQTSDPTVVSGLIYNTFLKRPDSTYTPPKDTSALGYDYYPDTQTVKIHFTNPTRGESPLSDANMSERQEEFRAMLEDVRATHPEAASLMSATWLRSTNRYRSLSPPDIDEQQNLMSPDMKLTGNSVWGQFLDASGNANQRVYDQFVEAIEKATNLEELLDAFPYKTMKSVDPIEKYYEYYGVESKLTSPEKES